tara:strand:- start:217 stop:477 length:261 start_codon:yes stop_codon:yes gene_type:complete
LEAHVSDEEPENEEAAALFFNQIVPGLWVGLLDMIHDLWMRLGDFMEQQSKIYSEVMDVVGTNGPEEGAEEGAEIIPFPQPEEEEE